MVADSTGAVVLDGTAARDTDGTTVLTLAGGHQIRSMDTAEGPVAATVFPWEITTEPAGQNAARFAQNHLQAHGVSVTTIGGRVRLGLSGLEHLTAEVSTTAIAHLDLQLGSSVSAGWRAAATRRIPLG